MLCLALAGCGSTPPQSANQPATDTSAVQGEMSVPTLTPAVGADAGVKYPLPAAPSPDVASTAAPFATRNAIYQPVRFADLPGWSHDDVQQSWDAFQHSCTALATRPGWSGPCSAARSVDAGNATAVRQFFERNFTAYQIRNVDRTPNGLMTGYYEPTLNGSRKRSGPYVYPVYGVPRDMLFLDQRRLPAGARSGPIAARIEGRTVIPLTTVSTGSLNEVYALELGDSVPDIRDKKLRLRLSGNKIVPYYSRAEIERGHLNAPILAYVDDPAMLYSMQLQGAGRIRLPDGATLRLAYAEQNGMAFNPPLASANAKGRKILVRGVELDVEEGEAMSDTGSDMGGAGGVGGVGGPANASTGEDGAPPLSPLLRGADSAAAETQTAQTQESANEPASQATRGFNLIKLAPPAVHPARANTPQAAQSTPPAATSGTQPHNSQATADNDAPSSLSGKPINYLFATSDPSYVFFKTIPDSTNGPIGALGVPLSAGRSAAIDPRTTPLGAPVFVSTSESASGTVPMSRLVMAQDAGGAIRGAVRVDFFFGSGAQAQAQASKVRQPAQMWVLLPNGLKIAARDSAVRVRGGAPIAPQTDCLISDPELCVDNGP
ncbi:hypothetical protein D0B32_00335 [Paraburkholderia sp. DHOC27]|nr:hypothetical protein D0B32_00335 [Paraburkholderia sp. DHOC27]